MVLENLWLAIALFIFVWIYTWAKGMLGSAKLAVLFAVIIFYLTIYSYPELVWIGVIIFFMATLGKDVLSEVDLKLHER